MSEDHDRNEEFSFPKDGSGLATSRYRKLQLEVETSNHSGPK